jgi:CBS domain-containing protein
MSEEKPQWYTILESVTIEQVLDMDRKLITVAPSTSASECLRVLSDNKVHGALVLDDEKLPLGFVDVYDVLSYIVFCLAGGTNGVPTDKLASFEDGDMGDASHMYGRNFAGSMIDMSDKDHFDTIKRSAKLTEAVKGLLNHHRLAVTDDDGNIVNVISQSDIVNFLTQCGHYIWTEAETHVGQLLSHADEDALVTVSPTDTVVSTLLKMYGKNVIAVAIVDENNAMVANFSASDLVGITRENLQMLAMPVMEFLNTVHPTVKPAVTVQEESNLELVFLKLSVYKIHRVWVVNAQNHPVGVLSLTDIMKYLNRYDLFL